MNNNIFFKQLYFFLTIILLLFSVILHLSKLLNIKIFDFCYNFMHLILLSYIGYFIYTFELKKKKINYIAETISKTMKKIKFFIVIIAGYVILLFSLLLIIGILSFIAGSFFSYDFSKFSFFNFVLNKSGIQLFFSSIYILIFSISIYYSDFFIYFSKKIDNKR